jgi:cell division protein FtsB
MKTSDAATKARLEELRQRLEKLDSERTAVSAELHRLTDPNSAQTAADIAQKDPIPGSTAAFRIPNSQKAVPNPA